MPSPKPTCVCGNCKKCRGRAAVARYQGRPGFRVKLPTTYEEAAEAARHGRPVLWPPVSVSTLELEEKYPHLANIPRHEWIGEEFA